MKINTLVVQVKREYWEHRRLFILAPLLVALLITCLECWAIISNPSLRITDGFFSAEVKDFFVAGSTADSARVNFDASGVLAFVVGLQQFLNWWFFAFVSVILVLQYCQSTLFQDRKSREILFWRSMPVSETTNVLIKLLVAAISLPLILTVMSFVSTLLSILVTSLWLGNWDQFSLAIKNFNGLFNYFQGSLILIPMVLPLLAWTLLVSAYVRRNPQLFAWWIPFFLWLIDRLLQKFFNITIYINSVVQHYLEYVRDMFIVAIDSSKTGINFSVDFQLYPTLLALAISIFFLLAAVWLRNNRYEI